MYNFEKVVNRKNSNSIKWDFINFMYPQLKHDVLPLWVADMDLICSDSIIKSLEKRTSEKIYGYSSFDDEYYNILIKWFYERYDYKITKENILYSPGIVPALGILLRVLTNERDKVIIQSPVYYPFKNMINNNNRCVVENNLINNNGYYTIDFEDLEKKAKDEKTKMLIFCSPHNPVGRVWNMDELEKVVEICVKYDLYLISDEIHCDLIRKNIKFHSLGKLKEKILNKLVICTAPSKTFNLAGLNLSNIIIFDEKIQEKWQFEIGNRMAVSNPTPFSISATKAAYKESDEWLKEVNDYIDNNLEYLKEYITKYLPKIKYTIPEGTYLAWLDFNEYNLSDSEITELILNNCKVAFDEGNLFGKNGEKFQRINVACSKLILKEALDKLKDTFENK